MKRILSLVLALMLMLSLVPMEALALTSEEQENVYRVGIDWWTEENQQHINWLLNSDNFIYHLDVTSDGLINQVKYNTLNLSSKKRKDNMVEILSSLIGFSSATVREEGVFNTLSALMEKFLGSFNSHVKSASSNTIGLELDISEAINKTAESYLGEYNVSTDLEKFSYAEIKDQILTNVPTEQKDMISNEFDLFIQSSGWIKELKSFSQVFKAVTKAVDVYIDGLAVIAELESYAVADEQLDQLLTYMYKYANDIVLKEACIEVRTKLRNNYFDNLVAEILEAAVDFGAEWTLDKVKSTLSSKLNFYLFAATIGIDAGKLVSDVWFNTSDQVELAQSMFCLNSITEALAKLLDEEVSDFANYKKNPFSGADYAERVIYHLRVLTELRMRGETAYYNLKVSTYSASMVQCFVTLGILKDQYASDVEAIEAWYQQRLQKFNALKSALFRSIAASEYEYEKEEEEEDPFVIENGVLKEYTGDGPFVTIPDTVHTIAKHAFLNHHSLNGVHIPASVTKIEAEAFKNCDNLSFVEITSSSVEIKANAFVDCCEVLKIYGYSGSTAEAYALDNEIEFVSLNNSFVDSFGYTDPDFVIEDGVLVEYRGAGGDVYVPYGVTAIGSNVFAGYANSRSKFNIICLPDTVVSICYYAFQYCDIQSLTLGNAVTDIDSSAFDDANINQLIIGEGTKELSKDFLLSCTVQSLELPSSFEKFTSLHNLFYNDNIAGIRKSIYVDSNNPHYSSVDGILYDKLETSLLFCPPEKEQLLNIPQTVTGIRSGAFRYCNIDILKLPTNITNIEQDAFIYCEISEFIYNANIPVDAFGEIDGWTQIGDCESPFSSTTIKLLTIGETVSAVPNFLFDTYNGNFVTVEAINFGSSVKVIGDRAFTSYDGYSISIPKSITHIGRGAFSSSSIREVYYYAQEAEIEDSPFGGAVESVVIGSTVVTVPDQLFYGFEKLQTVQFSSGVVRIGESAFEDCISLEEVCLPETVTTIESRAFSGCTQLEEFVIPSGVTTIGYRIIEDCEKLKTLTYNAKNALDAQYAFPSNSVSKLIIGEDVESLDDDVFAEMTALQTLVWGPTNFKNTTFPDAFGATNWVVVDSEFVPEEFVGTIKKLIVTRDVTVMPYDNYGHFQTALVELETMDYYAENCVEWYGYDFENIKEINIGETVEALPNHFLSQMKVASLVLPANVKSVGMFGFSNNEHLKELTILNKDFKISYGCFENCPNLTIYSFSSNTYLVYKCDELQIPFVAFCEHKEISKEITKEPTCTEVGSKTVTCLLCGYSYEEVLPISHTFSDEWTVDVPASCTTVGSKSHHCLNCDEKADVTEVPITHVYASVSVDSTCTEDGYTVYTCAVCGDSYTEIIPAAHQWSADWTVDIAPTDTAEGSQSRHCLNCDAKTDVTEIPMLSTESSAEDFSYYISNSEVTINRYIGTSPIMNIPAYIEGCPVTTISSFAFSSNTTITTASIPYTVTEVGYYAFYNCTELIEVKLGSGITELPEDLFSNCSKLQKVSLPANLTTIRTRAFYYCESLVEMAIPDTVEIIEDSSFYKCLWYQSITEDTVVGTGILMRLNTEFSEDVVIPDGVHTIYTCMGENVFTNTYVGQVTIPASLIHWDAADLWISVLEFTVHEDNPVFVSVDGVLYTKDMATIVAVPTRLTGIFTVPDIVTIIGQGAFYRSDLSEVVLPDGVLEIGEDAFCLTDAKVTLPNTVTTIGESAFGYNEAITEMVIPSGVTTLEGWTFNNCISLASITIPNSVTSIGAYAFNECTSLISIAIPESVTNIGYKAFTGCNNLTIHGYTGSFAETYAAENDIPFVALDTPTICNHDYADATCTAPKTCTVCGDTVGTAFGHDYADATCAVPKTCKNCGVTSGKALGHTYSNACDEACNVCGATRSVPAHKYDSGKVTKATTCKATGVKTYTCEDCGATKTETIAKAAHSYNAATCTEPKTCKNCGVTSGKALGHDYDAGKVTKKATCKATGVKTYTCEDCGATKTSTIAKLTTHTYKTTTTKASTSKNGSIVKECTVCGKVASSTTIKYAKTFTLSTTTYTYDGKVKTPTVTVKDSAGNTLKKNTDYTVTYASGRKNVGTYKVTIKMMGNYTGTKTLTFKINPASVSKCSLKLSATTYTYDGKVKTPSVTVKNASGTTLTKNTHYTVTYASGRKNVGTYKVTIKGKGNYTGTKTLTFKIDPAKTTVSKVTSATKSLKVSITKKATQVTGYQVQYSTSKAFTSAKSKTLTKNTTTSTTLTGLKAKTTYYVRVRTYKTVNGVKYYSGWSTVKSAKTK